MLIVWIIYFVEPSTAYPTRNIEQPVFSAKASVSNIIISVSIHDPSHHVDIPGTERICSGAKIGVNNIVGSEQRWSGLARQERARSSLQIVIPAFVGAPHREALLTLIYHAVPIEDIGAASSDVGYVKLTADEIAWGKQLEFAPVAGSWWVYYDISNSELWPMGGVKFIAGEFDCLPRQDSLSARDYSENNSKCRNENRRYRCDSSIMDIDKCQGGDHPGKEPTHAEWLLAWLLVLSPVIAAGFGALTLRGL